MNIHEYQAKLLLKEAGLPVLKGELCTHAEEAEAVFEKLSQGKTGAVAVVKAQIHAGGRGKAGGVKLAKSAYEAKTLAGSIIGAKLVTPQTGAAGKLVRKVYIEEGCNIGKEFYLSILLDRSSRLVSIISSSAGGTEIEELAKTSPDKIIKTHFDAFLGLQSFQVMNLGAKLGLGTDQCKKLCPVVKGLASFFLKNDLTLLEINPLVLTKEGEFILLDAKVAIDDNALFRHKNIAEMLDPDEMDPRDLSASQIGVNYIGLEGNIACMVNGAGLAMSTMDIIKNYGGKPANFLDVGGGASEEMIKESFKLLSSDKAVKAILVNIFGGIMRCDIVASGIVKAARDLNLTVPLVVRLQGTNVEEGRRILADSELKITPAATLDSAAKLAVEAAEGGK